MKKIGAILMQKNESTLLEVWYQYHLNIFHAEDIFILDNGSSCKSTLEILGKCRKAGINVISCFKTADAFNKKGEIVRRLAEIMQIAGYDFIFPTDCDEFLALSDHENFDFSRYSILHHLEHLQSKGIYKITQYDNRTGKPNLVTKTPARKYFIGKSRLKSLDIGFHHPILLEPSEAEVSTNIVHLHMHFVRHEIRKRSAINKMRGRLQNFQTKTINEFQGAGTHLLKELQIKTDIELEAREKEYDVSDFLIRLENINPILKDQFIALFPSKKIVHQGIIRKTFSADEKSNVKDSERRHADHERASSWSLCRIEDLTILCKEYISLNVLSNQAIKTSQILLDKSMHSLADLSCNEEATNSLKNIDNIHDIPQGIDEINHNSILKINTDYFTQKGKTVKLQSKIYDNFLTQSIVVVANTYEEASMALVTACSNTWTYFTIITTNFYALTNLQALLKIGDCTDTLGDMIAISLPKSYNPISTLWLAIYFAKKK